MKDFDKNHIEAALYSWMLFHDAVFGNEEMGVEGIPEVKKMIEEKYATMEVSGKVGLEEAFEVLLHLLHGHVKV